MAETNHQQLRRTVTLRIPDDAVTVELEVPFHDCDPLGVVWHGHYYKFFELARTALLRSIELDVPDIRALGYRFYVIESMCRYSAPLSYGDRVRVSAWFRELDNRIDVAYEIRNLSLGRRAARGHTILASTDSEGKLLLETPDALLHRLRRGPFRPRRKGS
jgi:acyl-CoA thioester hydrolase